MDSLIRANMTFLSQASDLLRRLDDDQFSQPCPGFYNSSVGGHLRHCLEHYESFLNGMDDARIDYDARPRDKDLEESTESALSVVSRIINHLETLEKDDPPVGVLVKMDCGAEEIEWQPSTLGRELQFLVSHTVHHFAMIGGICRELKVDLTEDFGVAPSTLRHRQTVIASD